MSKHGIVHIELPMSDAEESSKFYGEMFGWQCQTDEKFDYTMFQPGDGPGGGFSKLGEHTKPGDVIIYVDTDDIDGSLTKAEALGGSVVQPKMEIPGSGWLGIFTDPVGNRIGLWQGSGGSE